MIDNSDESVKGMIDDCLNVLTIPESRGGPGFNEWEQDFIRSLEGQYNKNIALYYANKLSEKQLEKLWAIWEKI